VPKSDRDYFKLVNLEKIDRAIALFFIVILKISSMNSIAQAFEKAYVKQGKKIDIPEPKMEIETNPEVVPMMYRAQISGRCGLQYGKNNQHLIDWAEQWIYPQEDKQPFYQYPEPKLGLDGSIYRFKLTFPFRVFSNCGQDSIARPVMGKDGIPFIPGSSIKGLFIRLIKRKKDNPKSAAGTIFQQYFAENKPEILRFHGAYPVDNWAATFSKQELEDNKQEKIPYRIVDVVHPQQSRQVEGKGEPKGEPKAIPIISFYNPTFIFELSCTEKLSEEEWIKISHLLKEALQPGLGGKTSSGYGLFVQPQYEYPVSMRLKGTGVSSTLRGGTPEFRPNMFKATLRGHVSRLLAGVCSNENEVRNKVNKLFGSNTSPGLANIFWNYKEENLRREKIGNEQTPVYEIKGDLYLDVRERDFKEIKDDKKRQEAQKNARINDLKLLQYALQFTYTMGGIGKSWRRVWHKGIGDWHPGFMSYETRAIGCHWQGEWNQNYEYKPDSISSVQELTDFLKKLHQFCQKYMGQNVSGYLTNWKEAWHPKRLKIYAQIVDKSHLIDLFHNNIFKTTPAIGGREPNGDRPTSISSVWHRMLPIDGTSNYLEIVTLFTSKESDWERTTDGNKVNQLQPFIQAITAKNSCCFKFINLEEIERKKDTSLL
jgi:CRISPR-associated protein Cmr6